MFLDHPVLGVGAGQFRTAYGLVYSGRAHGPWAQPHNLFLQVACELGIVGLLAFGYFLLQLVKANRSVLQLKGNPSCKLNYEVAVACGALMAGVLVMSVFGHTLYRPYWYLLGGLVGANRFLVDAAAQRSPDSASEDAGWEKVHPDATTLSRHSVQGVN